MPGGNSFSVTMDFDGSGTVQTRTFNLDSGVFFATVGQTAVFDWRGRIPERLAFQVSNGNKSIPVDISGAGDITVDDQIFADDAIPPVTVAQVNGDQLPDPTPVPTATPTPEYPPNGDPTPSPTPTPNGNGNGGGNDGGNGNGGGNPHETPSPTPPPTPEPTPTATPNPEASPTPSPSMQCSSSIDKTNLVLSQSNPATKSGTVTYTIANGSGANGSRTVTAAIVGGSRSLTFSISPSTLNNGGSAVITISSKTGNGNRGTFLVKIGASPACGSEKQVAVTVNN
jgi:hypothetical protein